MGSLRTILSSIACVGVLGTGYALWCVVPPEGERRRDILKNLPESNPVRLEETRQRNVLIMQVLKEAAETNENVARRFGGSAK